MIEWGFPFSGDAWHWHMPRGHVLVTQSDSLPSETVVREFGGVERGSAEGDPVGWHK